MKQFIAILSSVAVLSVPAVAVAHDGEVHNVMGTVTMVAKDHVMVKTAAGKDVTIKTNTATKVVQGKTVLKLADIKVGSRVVIVPVSEKDAELAKEIQVGTAAAPAAAAAAAHTDSGHK